MVRDASFLLLEKKAEDLLNLFASFALQSAEFFLYD